MIKTKIVQSKKFVSDYRVPLAFIAGSLVTATSTYYALGGNVNLLKVTKEQAAMLKEGQAAIEYHFKDQTLTLMNIAACEAAQAAL